MLYHTNGSVTGRELVRQLGISGGTDSPNKRPQRLIRWGNRADIRFNAVGGVLNKKSALNDASNKGRALELLTNAGINVPPAATRFDGELLVGRPEAHQAGSGFFLITSQRDFELAQRLGATHFMKYIPCQREYRIHTFLGRVLGAAEKLMQDDATSLVLRNRGSGWSFRYSNIDRIPHEVERIAVEATQALGLDFAGVDILKSVNNQFYVLELNSAPSLVTPTEGGRRHEVQDGPMFQAYLDAFKDWLETAR